MNCPYSEPCSSLVTIYSRRDELVFGLDGNVALQRLTANEFSLNIDVFVFKYPSNSANAFTSKVFIIAKIGTFVLKSTSCLGAECVISKETNTSLQKGYVLFLVRMWKIRGKY